MPKPPGWCRRTCEESLHSSDSRPCIHSRFYPAQHLRRGTGRSPRQFPLRPTTRRWQSATCRTKSVNFASLWKRCAARTRSRQRRFTNYVKTCRRPVHCWLRRLRMTRWRRWRPRARLQRPSRLVQPQIYRRRAPSMSEYKKLEDSTSSAGIENRRTVPDQG